MLLPRHPERVASGDVPRGRKASQRC
jgi:hypothetical protein